MRVDIHLVTLGNFGKVKYAIILFKSINKKGVNKKKLEMSLLEEK